MNTTHVVKQNEIERKWYILDAANKPIGKVAVVAATILRGKHKPTYTPNLDMGDHVIILNASKAILTGNKLDQKKYTHFTGYIGGMKEIIARDVMKNNPERALREAVKGMLPKGPLGRQMLTKLRVYKDEQHENQAQKPEIWSETDKKKGEF